MNKQRFRDLNEGAPDYNELFIIARKLL